MNPSSRGDAEGKRVPAILVGATAGLRKAARLNDRGRKHHGTLAKEQNRPERAGVRAGKSRTVGLLEPHRLGHLAHGWQYTRLDEALVYGVFLPRLIHPPSDFRELRDCLGSEWL